MYGICTPKMRRMTGKEDRRRGGIMEQNLDANNVNTEEQF